MKGYAPQDGDLVFLNRKGPAGSTTPDAVAIVTDANGSSVDTIEGDNDQAVRHESYSLNSACIVGYMSMRAVMEAYDANYKVEDAQPETDTTDETEPKPEDGEAGDDGDTEAKPEDGETMDESGEAGDDGDTEVRPEDGEATERPTPTKPSRG